jgi:homoserine kinase
LPQIVPYADAAANAGRAGLLVHALTANPDLLLDATRDWLHQSYREPAMPRSYELLKTLRSKGFAAVISGAGPAVLVLGRSAELDPLASVDAPGFQRRRLGIGVAARVVELT